MLEKLRENLFFIQLFFKITVRKPMTIRFIRVPYSKLPESHAHKGRHHPR